MKFLRPMHAAYAFLTRLPGGPGDITADDLSRSLPYFPAVGAVLGLFLTLPYTLSYDGELHAPASVIAVIIVALHLLMTGGLHIDGVADLFDALGGGKGDRERMLEIMRDSHIGAHGAAAMIVLLAAKISAITEILSPHSTLRSPFLAFLLFPCLARWSVVICILVFPYARKEGLGSPFTSHRGFLTFLGATICAAPVFPLLSYCLPAAIVSVFGVLILAALISRKLGGLTGDVYGALIEICETVFLITAVIRW